MAGLGTLGATGAVLRNLDHGRASQASAVTRLASGLRITTAADDPSGLAVSQKRYAQAAGYDAAVGNVQTASNALGVADGALQTTTDILQRIRALAVSAANDLQSTSDRSTVQAEIAQLLDEVNRIARNTTFNGVALLDGSHAGDVADRPASLTVASDAVLASAAIVPSFVSRSVSGSFGDSLATPVTYPISGLVAGNVYNLVGTFTTAAVSAVAVKVLGVVVATLTSPGSTTFSTNFTATGSFFTDRFEIDSTLGHVSSVTNLVLTDLTTAPRPNPGNAGLLIATAVAANANFQTTAAGTAGLGGVGTTDGSIEVQVVNTGASIAARETFYDTATGLTSIASTLLAPGSTSSLFDNVQLTLGGFGSQDVGTTAYVRIDQNTPAKHRGNAIRVHEASDEGDVLAVELPDVGTGALRIANASVATSLAASDTIGSIDGALAILLAERAALGAQLHALGDAAANGDTASNLLTASASAIADANVGAESTTLAKSQIATGIGASLLAALDVRASDVLRLFNG